MRERETTSDTNNRKQDGFPPFIPQRADPFVCKDERGMYYFTASVPAYDRIILRRSETLMGLAQAEELTVWTKHEMGPMSQHIWAPELHFVMGKWYLYFAAGERDDIWKIRPYVLECQGTDPMTDPWEEKGMMRAAQDDEFSFTSFSLDATILREGDDWYYIWAQKVSGGKGISNLYIAQMENPYTLKTAQVLLTTPDYDWERVDFWVNEGPAVIRRNGKIYLTYSASATGACYCMGMLSTQEGKDLLDPLSWKKERYPILTTDRELGIYGPGHNSFVKDETGRDICCYHARPYEEIVGDSLYDPNRHAMLMEVTWTKDDVPQFHFK
ncbi:MAG: family 43 glycosylhydrolase [Lachnospiraceae bacterium]|nr:family 43 glycosylhydrolase [Lachnospiraceae bacterium]